MQEDNHPRGRRRPMSGDDALRQVLAAQLEQAKQVIAELLDLLDRKFVQISWRETDMQVVENARAFLADNSR